MRGFLRFLGGLWIVAGAIVATAAVLCLWDGMTGGLGYVTIPHRGEFGPLSFALMAAACFTIGALLTRAGEPPQRFHVRRAHR